MTTAMLITSLSGLSWSQEPGGERGAESEPVPAETDRTFTPQTAVSGSQRTAAEKAQASPADGIGNSKFDMPATSGVALLTDEVPLPVPAEVAFVDGVDTVIAPASGDPFFLGFAGSKHYPPANELLDPKLVEATGALGLDGRPEPLTYAFVMFSKRITEARLDELRAAGCRVLGFHPHYTMRVAVPATAVGDISTLDFVRWIGVSRGDQKLHPAMRATIAAAGESAPVRVFVSAFEEDSMGAAEAVPIGRAETLDVNGTRESLDAARAVRWQSGGWMQRAIEAAGGTVSSYAPGHATFEVEIQAGLIEALLELDFVQFVEPVPEAALMSMPAPHETSRAMISSDRIRLASDGGTNQVAIVGVIDTGIEDLHNDLRVVGVGWNCGTGGSPWDDIGNGTPAQSRGHGTHVTGTILGRGNIDAAHVGNAPGVATWGGASRLFNFRRFPSPCNLGLDVLVNVFKAGFTDGAGNFTRKPHVVNNSWGSFFTDGTVPTGTEFNARVSDAAVFDEDQLWVWAAGNAGSSASTMEIESSAKNSFSIGAITTVPGPSLSLPGTLGSFSSRGPTADLRWKPSIAAPGTSIESCDASNNNAYFSAGGTSMAAPHVTGTAAMLIDRHAFLRDAPERLQALMMATATPYQNYVPFSPNDTHLDLYGAGRVSALKAAVNLSGNTWSSWAFEGAGAVFFTSEFTVPQNCARVVVAMVGIEDSASAGASVALVNDWDLYVDQAPFASTPTGGEYIAQQSTRNNVEMRAINAPSPGTWKWTVYPDSVSSLTKLGVCVYYIMNDTTPDTTLSVTADDIYIQPNETLKLSATLDVHDYVANSVVLNLPFSNNIQAARTFLADGVVTDLPTDLGLGAVVLGDCDLNFNRRAEWDLLMPTEGTRTINVRARGENISERNAAILIRVDGTDPSAVTNLRSTTHTIGEWSNLGTINFAWTAATDNLSGLDGYGIYEATGNSIPGEIRDIGPVTSFQSGPYGSSSAGRYFNIRSVDRSGNWDAQWESVGPYFIDTTPPLAPTTLIASSHAQGSFRCEDTVTVRYAPSTDAHAGLAGYSYRWTNSHLAGVDATVDTTAVQLSETLSPGTWFLHVRAVDNAGNASASTATFGPFTILDLCGTSYCAANLNSTGLAARIIAVGSDDASSNGLVLQANRLPANSFAMVLTSATQGFVANPGGSQGNLCLAGQIGRYGTSIQNTGAQGRFTLPMDLTATPTPFGNVSVSSGETRYWQAWFRDSNPTATSNYTDGVEVTLY